MVDRAAAGERIASLFPDGGEQFLAEVGLGASWLAALGTVPEERLVGTGIEMLTRARDHWSRLNALRPAVAATRAIVRVRSDLHGQDHPDTLVELAALGALADRAGRPDDAEQMLDQAWRKLRSIAGGRDLRLAVVASHVGMHHLRRDDMLRAEAAFDQAYRIRRDLAPETIGQVAAQLGELKMRRNKPDDARPYLEEALEWYRARYGDTDDRVVNRARTLAHVLVQCADPKAAAEVQRMLYKRAVASGDAEEVATTGFALGRSLDWAGETEEAMRLVADAVAYTRSLEELSSDLPLRLGVYARMIQARRRAHEAEGLLTEALDAEKELYGPASPEVGLRMAELGFLCRELGRTAEALGWLDVACSLLMSTRGPEHHETRTVAEQLALILIDMVEAALAGKDKRLAQDLIARAESVVHPVFGYGHLLAARLRRIQGR